MTKKKTHKHNPLAYDIKDLAIASGRGRSTIFQEIGNGRLIARKAGGKTIVLYDDAVAWLDALPVCEPSRSGSRNAAAS